MKSEYFTFLLNDVCCSLQNFGAIALKKNVMTKCSPSMRLYRAF